MKPLKIVLLVLALCLTLTGLAALIPFKSKVNIYTTGGLYALEDKTFFEEKIFL